MRGCLGFSAARCCPASQNPETDCMWPVPSSTLPAAVEDFSALVMECLGEAREWMPLIIPAGLDNAEGLDVALDQSLKLATGSIIRQR